MELELENFVYESINLKNLIEIKLKPMQSMSIRKLINDFTIY